MFDVVGGICIDLMGSVLGVFKEGLTNIFPGFGARRDGEKSSPFVCPELVEQDVVLRHFLVEADEAVARIVLIADEKHSGIIFETLPPGRPSFRDGIHAVVVGE